MLKNPQLNGAAGVTDPVKSVTAPDAQTVVWTLTHAQPRFHYRVYAGVICDGVQESARIKVSELDKRIDQIDAVSPDAPDAKPLYDKALEISFDNRLSCPSI